MKDKAVIVSLMGGLGNQMFQYAAARAMARRNSAQLVLDATTGFLRDKIYKRHYELDRFAIKARKASRAEQLPFWIERIAQRLEGQAPASVIRRPWGTVLTDTSSSVVSAAFDEHRRTLFLRGYWQSEVYFADIRGLIGSELRPSPAGAVQFAQMARQIEACNSVAVGVRLFEEVLGDKESAVGGLVKTSYYNSAARLLSESIDSPEFFVFCTSQSPELDQLDLPGPVHFITHENGYIGTIERLWLLSRCHNHIISNSSFYWWGAWFAEFERPQTKVVAIDKFPNDATVPARWMRIKPDA
jgi:hypothetical protein